jgi:hypothetical protein
VSSSETTTSSCSSTPALDGIKDSDISGSANLHPRAGSSPSPDGDKAAIRRAAARTNKAGFQLALLASCGGKRWVVKYAGPVFDELDAAIEGSAIDHVERDVGVAVVDAF